jgi:hypothetical protein
MNAPAFTAAPGERSIDEPFDEQHEPDPTYDEVIDANERLARQRQLVGQELLGSQQRVQVLEEALRRIQGTRNIQCAREIARDVLDGVQF